MPMMLNRKIIKTREKPFKHDSSVLRILVVEDNVVGYQEPLVRILENLGYTVAATAVSGIEAIEKAKTEKPDLILMDLSLKGLLDGFQTAQQIYDMTGIKCIFLTAYERQGEVKTPCYGYLEKKPDPYQLKHALALLLKNAGEALKKERQLKAAEAELRDIFERFVFNQLEKLWPLVPEPFEYHMKTKVVASELLSYLIKINFDGIEVTPLDKKGILSIGPEVASRLVAFQNIGTRSAGSTSDANHAKAGARLIENLQIALRKTPGNKAFDHRIWQVLNQLHQVVAFHEEGSFAPLMARIAYLADFVAKYAQGSKVADIIPLLKIACQEDTHGADLRSWFSNYQQLTTDIAKLDPALAKIMLGLLSDSTKTHHLSKLWADPTTQLNERQGSEVFNKLQEALTLLSQQDNENVIIENMLSTLIATMLEFSALRDNETGGHLKRVKEKSDIMMAALIKNGFAGIDISDEEKTLVIRLNEKSLVGQAMMLHDIGKVGTPDHILLKPGKLTDEEFEIMKKHVFLGVEIIGKIRTQTRFDYPILHDLFKALEHIIGNHHERVDGKGYPGGAYGMKGAKISFLGRLMALVDVDDALRHKRVYKPAWPRDKVLAEIIKGSGTQFDPKLMELYLLPEIQDTFETVDKELPDES